MTIREAIQHCREVAAGLTEQGKCPECAAEHEQLAGWLEELVAYKDTGLSPAGRKPDGGLEQYTELDLLAELSRRVHKRELDCVELVISPPDFSKLAHVIKEGGHGK